MGPGGLFSGNTGPLLSTFIPPLVRDALAEDRTAIGTRATAFRNVIHISNSFLGAWNMW
jgi:hypothetical protein